MYCKEEDANLAVLAFICMIYPIMVGDSIEEEEVERVTIEEGIGPLQLEALLGRWDTPIIISARLDAI